MKNTKKVVSFLLAFVMVFTLNFTTAFASEATENENIFVEEPIFSTSEDEGIMPLVWHEFTSDVPPNSSVTISGYNVPERYIAFESAAIVMGGGTNGGSYNVQLLNFGGLAAGHTQTIDGQMHKLDRIDLHGTGNNCGFKITNHSGVGINVHIIFYSWS